MVGSSGKSGCTKALGNLIHPFAAEGIDDAGLILPAFQECAQLGEWLLLGHDRVGDVRAVETGHINLSLLDPQLPDDVLAGLRVGRSGHGHHRHAGKKGAYPT